jgi:hypothetical protein
MPFVVEENTKAGYKTRVAGSEFFWFINAEAGRRRYPPNCTNFRSDPIVILDRVACAERRAPRLAKAAAFTHYARGVFGGWGNFMNAIARWGFHFAPILTTVLFVSAGSTSAFAYTPEQEQACTPDAMRLCGNYIPDVDRITACMIANKSQLSAECRRFFRAGPEPDERAAGQATNIKPVVRKTSSSKAKKPKKPAKPAAT